MGPGPPRGRGGVMTMQCLKYPQVQGLCIPSWGLFVNPKKNGATRGVRAIVSRDRIDHVEARKGGGSVKADQVPRGKLWRAIKIASICFGQAGENIALFCLIEDDVHPYRKIIATVPYPVRHGS